jgi:hypothetical protein
MIQINKNLAASDALQGVMEKHKADKISFADLNTSLKERGFGLLMLIFAMPISLPLPLPPGLTSLPAIPLLLFSIQMIMGLSSPWLPAWIGNKSIKRTTLAMVIEKAAPILRKIEKQLKPRLSLASSRTGERIIGVFAFIFATCIIIPLPLTHMVPAIGISIMSLGLLSKDGITIIIGMIIGSVGTAISMCVVILGEAAFHRIIEHFFS